MKKSYITVFLLLALLQVSFSQTYQWVKSNSISINLSPDYVQFPSATDASGNFIVCSIFNFKLNNGLAFFGDVIFRKYNTTGSQILSKVFTGKATIKGIETDANDNIYLYGAFMDTLIIDGANILLNTGSGQNVNDYLIKLSSTGNVIWKKNISAIYGNDFEVNALKVKSNFILTGIFIPSFQGLIKKFDLNGNEQLSFSINPARTLSGLDADPSGNILIAGSCQQGNVNFAGINANCPYAYSLFFTKISSAGTGIWAKFVEDVTFESPHLVCDNSGNTFACGELNLSTMFGTIQTMGPQWVYDFYLTKFDASGTFLWVKEVPHTGGNPTGDAGLGRMENLKTDAQNNAYIVGFQRGTINWGNFTTTSAGTNDLLVMKFASNGNFIWGKTAGGTNGERGDAVSLDNSNNIYVSGNFNNFTMFDTISITGSGLVNSFAAKLSNPSVNGVEPNNNVPYTYSLSNYPNPFNPKTIISYQIPISGNVKLSVFDITGKEISVLLNQKQEAGTYNIDWNASDHATGIYFCKLETAGYSKTLKMVMAK